MPDAAGWFQNAAMFKPEPLQRGIHGTDERRGSVVGVECGCPCGIQLVRREEFFKLLTFCLLGFILGVENVRQPAPAHVAHKDLFFLLRSWLRTRFKMFQQFDGREVGVTLGFKTAAAQLVGVGDAIIVFIAEGSFLDREILDWWKLNFLAFNRC